MTIKETIETIVECYKEITGNTKIITWDSTKTNGDPIRCLGSKKQKQYESDKKSLNKIYKMSKRSRVIKSRVKRSNIRKSKKKNKGG